MRGAASFWQAIWEEISGRAVTPVEASLYCSRRRHGPEHCPYFGCESDRIVQVKVRRPSIRASHGPCCTCFNTNFSRYSTARPPDSFMEAKSAFQKSLGHWIRHLLGSSRPATRAPHATAHASSRTLGTRAPLVKDGHLGQTRGIVSTATCRILNLSCDLCASLSAVARLLLPPPS